MGKYLTEVDLICNERLCYKKKKRNKDIWKGARCVKLIMSFFFFSGKNFCVVTNYDTVTLRRFAKIQNKK